jgi:hypothetical protein
MRKLEQRNLQDAHLPTFFKLHLKAAAARREKMTYYDVGFQLGELHVNTFDLDEDRILGVTDHEERTKPTATLRWVLANEAHPFGGDLVNMIPYARRRSYLEGLVDGVQGQSRY